LCSTASLPNVEWTRRTWSGPARRCRTVRAEMEAGVPGSHLDQPRPGICPGRGAGPQRAPQPRERRPEVVAWNTDCRQGQPATWAPPATRSPSLAQTHPRTRTLAAGRPGRTSPHRSVTPPADHGSECGRNSPLPRCGPGPRGGAPPRLRRRYRRRRSWHMCTETIYVALSRALIVRMDRQNAPAAAGGFSGWQAETV
jgi:hypothetical protein